MTGSSEMFLFHSCSGLGDPWDSGQSLAELREGGGSLQELLSLSPVQRVIHTNQKQSLVLQQQHKYNWNTESTF